MYMYGEILHVNMSYSEDSKLLTKETFNYIANVSCKEGDVPKDYFSISHFKRARRENPAIFEWINQPEKFIKELSDKNNSSSLKIPLEDFQFYHAEVSK